MTPWPSQVKAAEECYAILKQYGVVYLAGEERTGKLLTSVLISEMCQNVTNVLVLTTKRALDGWRDTLSQYNCIRVMHVTNYHQAKSLTGKYDLIILDECHNYLSGYPKPSGLWATVKKLCVNKPIVYTSATPYAQGPQLLYHQLALSSWSPWAKYKTFYSWFDEYGVDNFIWLSGRKVKQYTEVEADRVLHSVKHLFVTMTRAELGFVHEPVDKVHYVELSEMTKTAYNELLKKKILHFENGDVVVGDTTMKLRTLLHQIEGGGIKILQIANDRKKTIPKVLKNTEKIDYIKANWGDTKEVGIMYQYISEGIKLREHFQHAEVLQATTNAEGVDLSHLKHLVIYSQDFRTAKYSQRRARQANKFRNQEIIVHFLLVVDAISEQVYETVSVNKMNFVDGVFQRKLL